MIEYGSYVELLRRVQADPDVQHRQHGWDEITRIAPIAGSTRADGTCAADPHAEAAIRRLYPAPGPAKPVPAAAQLEAGLIAETSAQAEAYIAESRSGFLPKASDLAPKAG